MNTETLAMLGARLDAGRPFSIPPSTNPNVLKLKAKAQEMWNRAEAVRRNADSLHAAGEKASLEGDGESADRFYKGAKDARLEMTRLLEWVYYYEQLAKDAANQPPPKIPLRGLRGVEGALTSQLAAMGAQPLGQEIVLEEEAGPELVTTAEGVGFVGGLAVTILGGVFDWPSVVTGFGTSVMAAAAFSSIARQSQ